METYTTEALLRELEKRAQGISSSAEAIAMLKGVAAVSGEMGYCQHIPDRNQGMVSIAEDALLAASHLPHAPEIGPFTAEWKDQIGALSARAGMSHEH